MNLHSSHLPFFAFKNFQNISNIEIAGGNPGDSGCLGDISQSQLCNMAPCEFWGEWMTEDPSFTCGKGTVLKTRSCIGGLLGDAGCIGIAQETITVELAVSNMIVSKKNPTMDVFFHFFHSHTQ